MLGKSPMIARRTRKKKGPENEGRGHRKESRRKKIKTSVKMGYRLGVSTEGTFLNKRELIPQEV